MHTGAQDGLIDLLSTGAIHMAVTYDLELSHRVSFETIVSVAPLCRVVCGPSARG